MPSGDRYLGFFNKQIIGAADFEDQLLNAGFDFIRRTVGEAFGEAVINSAGTASPITVDAEALGDRRLTIGGSNWAITDSGDTLQIGNGHTLYQDSLPDRDIDRFNPAWFEDLPYRNQSGQTYRVYAKKTRYPVDVGIGRSGGRGYSSWVDVVGFEVNPDLVTVVGDHLELRLGTALTSLGIGAWNTVNVEDDGWSRMVCVYLDTDQEDVEIANDDYEVAVVYGAKMVKSVSGGNSWLIDLDGLGDGNLGQSTPSTTTTHYKIVIFGPIITTTDFDSNEDYLLLGTVLSGVTETISTGGQIVMPQMNAFVSGFGLDHEATPGDPELGRHKQITASAGAAFAFSLEHGSDATLTMDNVGAGGFILKVADRFQVGDIINVSTDPIEVKFNQASTASFDFANSNGSNVVDVHTDGGFLADTRVTVGATPTTTGHRLGSASWQVDGLTSINWGVSTPLAANWIANWDNVHDIDWDGIRNITLDMRGQESGAAGSTFRVWDVNNFIITRDAFGSDAGDSFEVIGDFPLIRMRIDPSAGEFRIGHSTATIFRLRTSDSTIDIGQTEDFTSLIHILEVDGDADLQGQTDINTFTVSDKHVGTLESDEFNFATAVVIEAPQVDMNALASAVESGLIGISAGGTWAGGKAPNIAGAVGMEGHTNFNRSAGVHLTSATAGDSLPIPLPIIPGCALYDVTVICEANAGNIDIALGVYSQTYTGTGGSSSLDTDTENVSNTGRKAVVFDLNLAGTIHGLDHASGNKRYYMFLDISAVNAGATALFIYDIIVRYTTTDLRMAYGNTAG